MKKNLKMLIFTAAILELNGQAFGFCGDSHASLTQTAILNSVLSEYLRNQLDIQQGLNGILTIDQSVIPPSERIPSEQLEERIALIVPLYPTVRDLLECGSRLEDIPNPRAKHHFHDPYRNAGLNNKTEHPALSVAFSTVTYAWYWGDNKFDLTGASNLKRASNTEDPNWEQEYENFFAWPDARNYLYKVMTEESPETRVHYLALTFLSLGHVLHLLEDMGVPPHARNDFIEAHFRGLYPGGIGNPLEKHVEDEIKALGVIPERWLEGWTPQAKVFSKLSHYWDVGDYTGSYDVNEPNENWGLAECTNYQFLSKSTIFREDVIIDPNTGERTRYYFPHPDVNNVTEHIDTEAYLWGLVPVDYRYISGYDITHLARTKFTQKYAYMSGMTYPTETVAYHTTFDEAVYEDYAKVTIPRTIDYATGLANYFFRGRLSVEQVDSCCTRAVIRITNNSQNSDIGQTLKGGTFELYWDDPNSYRTKIADTNFTVFEPAPSSNPWNSSTSTLAYNQSTEAIFTIPEGDVEKYILVYKGNICQDPNDPDLDDTNAIATATFDAVGCVSIPDYMCAVWSDSAGSETSCATLTKDPENCCWKGTFENGAKAGQSVVLTCHVNGWHGWYGSSSCDYSNDPISGKTWSKSLSCSGGFVQLDSAGAWEKITFTPTVIPENCCVGLGGCHSPDSFSCPVWDDDTTYDMGDCVSHGGTNWKCIQGYVPPPAYEPGVPGSETYWTMLSGCGQGYAGFLLPDYLCCDGLQAPKYLVATISGMRRCSDDSLIDTIYVCLEAIHCSGVYPYGSWWRWYGSTSIDGIPVTVFYGDPGYDSFGAIYDSTHIWFAGSGVDACRGVGSRFAKSGKDWCEDCNCSEEYQFLPCSGPAWTHLTRIINAYGGIMSICDTNTGFNWTCYLNLPPSKLPSANSASI